MFKKDIRANKGTDVVKHHGKGSSMAPMPNRNTLAKLQKPAGQSINDYAKASPMGQSAPPPDGLGSGDWGGIGM